MASARRARTAASPTVRKRTHPPMAAMARSQGRETMEDNSPRRRKSESKTMSYASSSRKQKFALTISADSHMANLCSSHLHTSRLLTDKSTQEVAIGQMAAGRNEPCDIFRII